jgi:hypothetical protein
MIWKRNFTAVFHSSVICATHAQVRKKIYIQPRSDTQRLWEHQIPILISNVAFSWWRHSVHVRNFNLWSWLKESDKSDFILLNWVYGKKENNRKLTSNRRIIVNYSWIQLRVIWYNFEFVRLISFTMVN